MDFPFESVLFEHVVNEGALDEEFDAVCVEVLPATVGGIKRTQIGHGLLSLLLLLLLLAWNREATDSPEFVDILLKLFKRFILVILLADKRSLVIDGPLEFLVDLRLFQLERLYY